MALTTRAEKLLKTLIERYIAEGQPVGSRTLARHAGLELSPATVRNVMADLEEMGLVVSPHTSAGRVPTERGYRVFVDSLLQVRPLSVVELRKLEHELLAAHDPQELIECASNLLSEVSHLAGLVMVPRREAHVTFRQIDFVALTGQRVLVILVTEDGGVHNRIIHPDREYSPSELVEASNYFNETYAGRSLSEVKHDLLSEMQKVSDDMHRIMRTAIGMARQAFSDDDNDDSETLVVSGESNLMDVPDLGDVRKLRRLFEAFNTKRDLLHLLDRSLSAGGVKIFIGSESGCEVLRDCSVVTASYRTDGHVIGTLGVIGPTRMSYDHIIAVVDVTARLLSMALSSSDSAPRLES